MQSTWRAKSERLAPTACGGRLAYQAILGRFPRFLKLLAV